MKIKLNTIQEAAELAKICSDYEQYTPIDAFGGRYCVSATSVLGLTMFVGTEIEVKPYNRSQIPTRELIQLTEDIKKLKDKYNVDVLR